ncbi:hypothetical protein ENSA5_17300 [Enhygromyxa salina]|uniref:Lipoprotein MlpA n=1 Tax=Enhygromyxa salina TaxID=215803 RepID=A0A2S9YDV8_9BACT|nr:hypothetical protein [Enhygromyxa salina]PRQ03293.1 hypothetical protein ENSA5_17300 [Enhygromyxa salina]
MLTRSIMLSTSFAFAAAATVAFGASCAQPVLNCTSAHGAFAAEYSLTKGDPDAACAQLQGDVLGIQTYFQAGGPNGTPDYQRAKVAIRPRSLGARIDDAAARGVIDADELFHRANAVGAFTAGFPDDQSFCQVEDFADAEVSLPELPAVPDDAKTPDEDESRPAEPASEIRYRWSGARFVVSADAQGTQFEAELELRQDGCEAEYHVVGVYPSVACETDEECNDETNGINPDFALRCNTSLGLCVLDKELPAYEDAT